MEIKTISRKQQIEEKATELFRNKGYAATSMRDLALELNIEAASLYSHIKSKEEILQKICFKMARQFFDALDKVSPLSGSASEKLEKIIIEHIVVVTVNHDASAVFFNEWRHLSEPYLSNFVKMRQQYEQSFIKIIEEGQFQNEFQKLDTKFISSYLISSINWTYNWYKPSGKLAPEELGRQVAGLLIRGLKSSSNEN